MVIILGTCTAVLSSIYYNTIALQNTYGSVNTYYWAYYWALSSIERWLLMTKIKYPWYVWSWWFIWDNIIWANSNSFSWDFWRFSHWNNTMLWSVNSKTNRIVGTIDNKTLRVFSFTKYIDYNPNEYYKANDESYYWINEGLQFSGNIKPYTWWTNNIQDWNMDFNRFFNMRNDNYIVRWLHNWTNMYDRQNNLTWYFNFWIEDTSYAKNPWPTLTWAWSADN